MVVMLFNMCNSNDFNRKACMKDWDEWLYPALYEAYQTKRDALQSQHGPNTTD